MAGVQRHPNWRTWQLFFERHAEVTALVEGDLLSGHGFSLRWYDVLLHLYGAPEHAMTMRGLSEAVVISKSGLTGLVDRMQREGLVERSPDPEDRRRVRVRLTADGAAAYERARPTHRASVAAHFLDRLSDAGAAAIRDALETLS
jgi:DNA-binding MarR family transcriptional regulator